MQFTTVPFFIFLFAVVVLYYILPHKYRNWLLLAASYYFYFSFKPEYLLILLGSTAVNYFAAKAMDAYPKNKKMLLGTALVMNLGVLFFFKYFNFFSGQVNLLLKSVSLNLTLPEHSLILPIGISFYTFMALGYILDVYWGDIKHQRNYLTFSLYLAFFPQILCGPIGRAKNLFKQYAEKHPLRYENFANGFRLILWGLFMKMVVADNIALYVDAVYGNIPMHSSITLLVTALLYPFQLYTDFAGYTNIARGVAKLLGFDLMINFKTPYVNSTSVTDYWKRNHISLTSWIREYVYYPFMGYSTSKFKVYLGILVMFLLVGIWHGASWMFMIWGAIQAIYLIVEKATRWDKWQEGNIFLSYMRRLFTFFLISLGLIFFRLPDISSIKNYVSSIKLSNWKLYLGSPSTIVFILIGLIILITVDLLKNKKQFDEWIGPKKLIFRWSFYICSAIITLMIGNVDGNAFIYFQF